MWGIETIGLMLSKAGKGTVSSHSKSILVADRARFHKPAVTATNIDFISTGRFTLNVVKA